MKDTLKQVQEGNLTINEAMKALASYEDLGFAKVDHDRTRRQGFPEIIFGEGKSADQINSIIGVIQSREEAILVTRISKAKAQEVLKNNSSLEYNETGQLLFKKQKNIPENNTEKYIAIISGGTSDLKVAEEAALTAELFGCKVERIYDVGVAGIHRLFDQIDVIRNATVSIVIAGMEGALPSVVGGLVSHPIIAVPTSVGYGANFQGLSALLTMINSCASGISVVNIDNGFGAAYSAVMIDRLARNAT